MIKKVIRIAIAGYMGAGKSTCARSFASEDALIIDADAVAKHLMASSRAIQDALREAFGETVVDADGAVCANVLGSAAFESVDALLTLNGITHPPLVEHLDTIVSGCTKQYCILDAALVPLLGIESWFDLCVWVDAPFETRLTRLAAKRPEVGAVELVKRMRMQQAVMSVPDGGDWVRVGDGECRRYITDVIDRLKRGRR